MCRLFDGAEYSRIYGNYMIMCYQQNVVQNQNTIIGYLSFENVEKFKYLGVMVTNTNDICEEIKHIRNMGNTCYYLLENFVVLPAF